MSQYSQNVQNGIFTAERMKLRLTFIFGTKAKVSQASAAAT